MTRFFITAFALLSLFNTTFAQEAELEEAIKGLKQANKERSPADQTHFLKILTEKWEAANKKQRKTIHSLVKRGLASKDDDVKTAMVEAICKMGGGAKGKDSDNATKILASLFKAAEDDVTYLGKLLVAVGKLGHKKGVPHLTKKLNYKDYDVVASATEGLGHYDKANLKLKKEIVKQMLKCYTSVSNQARDPRNNVARKRLDKINRPMEHSLKVLTGVKDVSGADAWWKWWNNVGKKARSWDS